MSAKALLVLSCTILICGPARSENKEILWMLSDWPPVYILNNHQTPTQPAELGSGVGDRVIKEIMGRLPGYSSRFIQANILRTWAEFAANKNICYATAYKNPEREKIAYFTPVLMALAPVVVVRHERRGPLGLLAPDVTIRALSSRTDLKGYIDRGRSFGATIDEIVNRNGSNLLRQVESNEGHLLQLLDSDRMDYTLEIPIVVEYESRHLLFQHRLDVLTIEDSPKFLIGYVACSKNEWGKTVINDIALAVRKAAATPSFQSIYTDMLPPDLINANRGQYKHFYNNLEKNKLELP